MELVKILNLFKIVDHCRFEKGVLKAAVLLAKVALKKVSGNAPFLSWIVLLVSLSELAR